MVGGPEACRVRATDDATRAATADSRGDDGVLVIPPILVMGQRPAVVVIDDAVTSKWEQSAGIDEIKGVLSLRWELVLPDGGKTVRGPCGRRDGRPRRDWRGTHRSWTGGGRTAHDYGRQQSDEPDGPTAGTKPMRDRHKFSLRTRRVILRSPHGDCAYTSRWAAPPSSPTVREA